MELSHAAGLILPENAIYDSFVVIRTRARSLDSFDLTRVKVKYGVTGRTGNGARGGKKKPRLGRKICIRVLCTL